MEIDEKATVLVRASGIVRASPDEVWRVLSDISGWRRWNPTVTYVSISEPLRPGAIFQWKTNGMTAVSRIEVADHASRLGWRTRGFGTRGAHLWTLTEVESETASPAGASERWTRIDSMETMDGWLTSILRWTIRRTLELSGAVWIRSMRDRVENP